ncbi:MAG: TatD family hydrolase, partial [Treponema sp.]|nr:TatD family hydrolase [Treponema sp.]
MKLIDIGINLMNPSYDRDRDEVVQAAINSGVSPLVITGSSERSSLDAALYVKAFAAAKPGVLYATAGVHPHEARNCGGGTMDFLRDLAAEKSDGWQGARAIGECGLDYNRDFSPRDVQRRWFVKQIELAAELSLPLFLHER